MACNMYRALLNEYANADIARIGKQAKILEFAIGNAPAFISLMTEEYMPIWQWCRDTITEVGAMESDPDFPKDEMHMRKLDLRDGLRNVIMRVLPKIGAEWLELGMPETAEEWMRRKYGGEDEVNEATD